MNHRTVTARIVKLEARRQRPNEILLVWRRPDQDVKEAISTAEFSPGNRVICAEWFSDAPLPEPKWYRDRLTSALDAIGNENLQRSIDRIAACDRRRDPAFVELPHVTQQRMAEMSDHELLHAAMGVVT